MSRVRVGALLAAASVLLACATPVAAQGRRPGPVRSILEWPALTRESKP